MTLRKLGHAPLAGGCIILQIGWLHLPAKISVTWLHEPCKPALALRATTLIDYGPAKLDEYGELLEAALDTQNRSDWQAVGPISPGRSLTIFANASTISG